MFIFEDERETIHVQVYKGVKCPDKKDRQFIIFLRMFSL